MKNPIARFAVMMCVLSPLVACGGEDSSDRPAVDTTEEAISFALDDGFDIADLPKDFPRDLVPPVYDRIEYVNMPNQGIEGASFESTEPVQSSIDHYVGLLGEPKINIDQGDGDRMVQWHETPYGSWMVSVLGHSAETIVGINKITSK